MKQFLRLVDIVNRKGIIGVHEERWTRLQPDRYTFEALRECQPIVFTRKNEGPSELGADRGWDDAPQIGPAKLEDFDAPFKYFSVEMLEGPICEPRTEDKTRMWIYCILCVELLPREFVFYTLCEIESDKSGRKEAFVFASNAESATVQALLDRMNTEQVGSQAVNYSIRIGSDKKHAPTRTIRRIVHVCPKRYLSEHPGTSRGTVQWSHRWLVRGHWVSLPGRIGKDREGNYCVNDWTWRNAHEKGPENAPLITKTRVVGLNKGA